LTRARGGKQVRIAAPVTDEAEILVVDVIGDEIRVSLPNTSYAVEYPKPRDPSLVLVNRPFAWERDSQTSMTPSKFLNRAYDVALMRGRELGWIV